MRASHAWIAAYAVTGALQPLLVDRLKQQGLAPARLLGPMMANLLGMTLVAPAREACVGSPAPIAQTIRASWRPLAAAAALDFGSAALLCVGLLYAGAAAFTLVYASCAPLVSAIGAAAGTLIRREQWLAIALATLGLALYELACKRRRPGRRRRAVVGIAAGVPWLRRPLWDVRIWLSTPWKTKARRRRV